MYVHCNGLRCELSQAGSGPQPRETGLKSEPPTCDVMLILPCLPWNGSITLETRFVGGWLWLRCWITRDLARLSEPHVGRSGPAIMTAFRSSYLSCSRRIAKYIEQPHHAEDKIPNPPGHRQVNAPATQNSQNYGPGHGQDGFPPGRQSRLWLP